MRSVSVNPKYQSTFMPIIQNAETAIKLAVLSAFLVMSGELALRAQIAVIVEAVARKLTIPDKEDYIKGLKASANKLIMTYYRKPLREFAKADMGIPLPKDAFMKSQAKGSVVIEDYAKKLKQRMKELAEAPMTTAERGKHQIDLWQKAELDVRYEHNMKMIEDLKNEGHDLCYISSHPDCSHRCERWQGVLVSLTKRAKSPQYQYKGAKSSFVVGQVDGKPVYALIDIMKCKDKYNRENSVISGYNCRHRLIPYSGQLPPTEYTKEDIKKQREVEGKIRAMEREIRKQGKYVKFLESTDPKEAPRAKARLRNMVANYKDYCNRNGYAWEKYRITV